jgi:hypothetical protein
MSWLVEEEGGTQVASSACERNNQLLGRWRNISEDTPRWEE